MHQLYIRIYMIFCFYSLFESTLITKEIFYKLLIIKVILLHRFQIKDFIGIKVSEILINSFNKILLGYPDGEGPYVFRPLTSTPLPISTTRNMSVTFP
jgi:hypothetical protein